MMRHPALLLLLAILAAAPSLAQHRLDSLEMAVVLYPDGHALVEETRTMYIGEGGTECFIRMNNLEGSTVNLVGVSDETFGAYLVQPSWDTSLSRQEKSGRCGTLTTSEGTELCWGVGSSGHHRYVITYNISRLVRAYTDADSFLYSFYEAATPPAANAEIIVLLDIRSFNHDSLSYDRGTRIWAFGYHGQINFFGRCVGAYTERPLDVGDKMILMMEFPKGIFRPEAVESGSFNYVKQKAFVGSDYDPENDNGAGSASRPRDAGSQPTSSDFLDLFLGLFCCCGTPVFLFLAYIITTARRHKLKNELRRREQQTPYVYQPPLGGRLVRSQILLMASLRDYADFQPRRRVSQYSLLQAFILRMLYRGDLQLVIDESNPADLKTAFRVSEPSSGSVSAEDEFSSLLDRTAIRHLRNTTFDTNLALNDEALMRGLQTILYNAAGSDHILQPQELSQYIQDEKDILSMRHFARVITTLYDSRLAPQQPAAEQTEVYGFFKYIRDFTLMPERHVPEVALWREFMVFAALFDLTKQAAADIRSINPDLDNLDSLTKQYLAQPIQDAVDSFAMNLTYVVEKSSRYETPQERAYSTSYDSGSSYDRGSSRSSGGGGSSSYRGGGGHRGGGGSGVR